MTCPHRGGTNLLTQKHKIMKKVFSLFLATVLAMSMFAQTKTVTTVEKLWSRNVANIGSTLADSRQGAGKDGKVYILNKANHSLVAISETAKDTIINGNIYVRTDTIPNGKMTITKRDSALVEEVWQFTYDTAYSDKIEDVYINLDGTAFALDDAGNFVMEGVFPSATPSHIVIRKADGSDVKDLAIKGLVRTDFINAVGDVFSAEGGYVFEYGTSSPSLLVYKIANGAIVKTDTVKIAGSGGGNYVITGNDTMQIAHHRTSENGWLKIVNGVATTINTMEGFKKTTLGGDIITLKGKEFYIYPTGTVNYNSEFVVRNMTDEAFVVDKADPTKTVFCVEDPTKNAGATSTACWLNATAIDDGSAYIHVYNGADGVALFKLSISISAEVTLSCNEAQGTVTGGGDIAVGANAKVEAVAKPGFEFVAWLNGTDTVSTEATYTFPVSENIALTAVFEAKDNVTITLAVNDANMGSITLPEGIQMGENSVIYGTELVLTAVPAEGATFVGWFSGDLQYSKDAQITLSGKESISLTAKFVNVKIVAYVLNEGVTNDYNWYTPSDMFADFMADAEATNLTYTLEDYKAMVEKLAAPTGICTYLTTPEKAFANAEKWGWLKTYIESVHADQASDGASALSADGSGAAWRYAIGAFFIDGQRSTWPVSANFEACGVSAVAAYQPVWKHGYDNPTEVTADFTLNTPYLEGYTFDGWYAEADFSGEKVTTVGPEIALAGNTLYAKWIEYIPTLKEVTAMAADEVTKAKGVVTYINNKNAYIQDATAGMLLFLKAAPTFQVGQMVVVKGTKTTYGGAPELKNVEEVSAENGDMPNPMSFAALASVTAEPLKYFGQRVAFKGLLIAGYDSNGNPSVTDNVDTVPCYKMVLDQQTFPVNTKVNLTAIAGYYNGFQFVGDIAGFEMVGAAGKDSYAYPALGENGEYTLTNKWLFSNVLDNYADNKPAADDFARGMVAKDGKMYFINRTVGGFTVVDGATGKMATEKIIITGEHLFQTEVLTDSATGAKEWKDCATLKFNDVKLDQAGHFLIGGCVSGGNRMQVYKVDITTGAATVVVDDRLYDYPDFELEGQATAWRFDAFNVYGDVDNHAIIMAADANSFFAYKWEITNGKAGAAERINCTPEGTDVSLIVKDGEVKETSFGTAPQIFPVDFNYFYVDGWSTLPMLFDMEGALVEDFATVPTGVSVPMPGDTCVMNTGHNGLCEFQIGDEYYLIMAATNTVGHPTSAFALYKFADENKKFSEMTPMWFFPQAGMGAATNGCRTAVPTVEVKDNIATLYIYTNNNGYGVYEMTGVKGGDAVENVGMDAAIKAEKRIENGMLYIIRNGVRYTAQGVVAQ